MSKYDDFRTSYEASLQPVPVQEEALAPSQGVEPASKYDAFRASYEASQGQPEPPEQVGGAEAFYKGLRESVLMGYWVPEEIKKQQLEEGFSSKLAYAAGGILGALPSFMVAGGAMARIPQIARMYNTIRVMKGAGKAVPLALRVKAGIPHSMATFFTHSALSKPPGEDVVDIPGRLERGVKGAVLGGVPFGVAGLAKTPIKAALGAGTAGAVIPAIEGEPLEDILTSSGLLAALSFLMHGKYERRLVDVKGEEGKTPREEARIIEKELERIPPEQREAIAEDYAAMIEERDIPTRYRGAGGVRQFIIENEPQLARIQKAEQKRAPGAAIKPARTLGERQERIDFETSDVEEAASLRDDFIVGEGRAWEARKKFLRQPTARDRSEISRRRRQFEETRGERPLRELRRREIGLEEVELPEGRLPGEPTLIEGEPREPLALDLPDYEADLRRATRAVGGEPGIAERGIPTPEVRPGEFGEKIPITERQRLKKGEIRVHRMPDGKTMIGPEHKGAVPGSEQAVTREQARELTGKKPREIKFDPKAAAKEHNLSYDGFETVIKGGKEIQKPSFTLPQREGFQVDTKTSITAASTKELESKLSKKMKQFEADEAAARKVVEAKVEPKPAAKIKAVPEAPTKLKPGSVYIKGKQIPFREFREITRGNFKGRFEVTLPNGKKVKVERADIAKMPEAAKAPTVTLETFGFQTLYENVKDFTRKVKEETPEKVRKFLKDARTQALTAVKGNPLDKISIEYLNTENLDAYIKAMPNMGELKPSEIWRFDPQAKEVIAGIRGKDGKIKPAIRVSGFHSLKEFDAAFEKATDVGKLDASWTDITRFIQKLDKGQFGGQAQQQILWPARMSQLAKNRYVDLQKGQVERDVVSKYKINNRKKAEAVGDVLEFISTEKAAKQPTSETLQHTKVRSFLRKFKPEEQAQIVDAAKASRKILDTWRSDQNKARAQRGQKQIKKIENYRQWVMEANLWSKLLGLKVRPKEIIESPEMPDFIQPNQPFNARAMARSGLLKGYDKKRNIIELLSDYAETAGKDIFDTNVVHHNKVHAAVLRARGLPNAAEGIERWTSEVFAGTAPRLTRLARETVHPAILGPVHQIRRNLTRAVFPLNWTWNLFVQTSSAGITFARYGARANLEGIKYFTDKGVRQAVKQNAYTSILKSRWGGKAAYQDIQGSILKNKKLDAKLIDKVEDYANFMTSTIEDALTGHAITAAMHRGKKLGLKDRALWEFASEGGAKTQSMYDYTNIPGLLRAKEVGALAPFQTFAFEVFNTMREMNVPGLRRIIGKTGAYETIAADTATGKALMSNRLKMLGRWTAAILVTNAVVDKAIGRKPWEISSFVPFIGYMLGGYSTRSPVPHKYVEDARKGIQDVLQYGSFRRLRKWLVQYHALAGTQINRTLDGIEAVSRGQVEDVAGRRRFPVKGAEEKIRAVTAGPYRTKAGIEFSKKRQARQGITGVLREKLGLIEPTVTGRRTRRRTRRRRAER